MSLPTLPAGPLYRVTAARKVTDSNTMHEKKFGNSVLNRPCCTNHERRENLVERFSPNPWYIYDHPPAMRQGEIHQSDYNKENEIKESDTEESEELRFDTKVKTQTTR